MTKDEHLKEQYIKLGYNDIMSYYEFIDRVKSGQLAIEEPKEKQEDER